MSFTIRMVLAIYFVVVFLLQYDVHSLILGTSTKCYDGLGCFSTAAPFTSSTRPVAFVPNSPDHIETMYQLYTRQNLKTEQKLDARKANVVKTKWTYFKNRPTKFIVHGYLDDTNIFSRFRDMKDEMLTEGDYNVIIVDWSHGNLFPYTQATANARVVGAQIAVLIKQLETDFKLSPNKVHIIGHSLGSHIAGYAGERILGMGRITGLDPAGPFFSGTDKVVRLDPTDALLVDVIHSDGEDILKLGLGMREAVGHMDFYPNLGHDQPGCHKTVYNFFSILIKDGIGESVACNHFRAMRFFTESINSKCSFMAFPCESEETFKQKKCFSCGKVGCAPMGFKADKYKPPKGKLIRYYVNTADDAPFCQIHLNVEIKLAHHSKATDERGTMQIRLHGAIGSSDWLDLDEDPIVYHPGTTYEREIGMARDLGILSHIEFQWHHKSSLFNPLKWNPFGLRSPKLYLSRVGILQPGVRPKVSFCEDNAAVENNEPLTLYKKCKSNI